MPPQTLFSTPGGTGSTSTSSSSNNTSTGSLFPTGSLSIKSPDGLFEYSVVEDWPRRSDSSGDTYRAVKRDQSNGSEIVVALKVAKARPTGGLLSGNNNEEGTCSNNNTTATQAWDQEVRLLRRLALLTSKADGSTHFTIEMVTEFGGIRALPSLRFMVSVPVCWKPLEARIKGVERGRFEPYSETQALEWCWQITRGLWALQEADIGYKDFGLRHCLLTLPEGEVRLGGFDLSLTEASEAGADTREGLWNLGKVLHMTLACSTDREDDRDYFKVGRAREMSNGSGGRGGQARRDLLRRSSSSTPSSTSTLFAPRPFLAAIPIPARPIVLGLLASPSNALPLGLALDYLGEVIGQDFGKEYSLAKRGSSSSSLRSVEEHWWGLVRQREEAEQPQGNYHYHTATGRGDGGFGAGSGGGLAESKSSGGASRLEKAVELAQACLDLGRAWEQEGKGYRAVEYLRDAVSLVEGEATWKGKLLAEAWGAISDIQQGRGNHLAALEELKKLAAFHEAELLGCQQRATAAAATSSATTQQEGWQIPVARQMQEDISARLADVRIRISLSLRELGDYRGAMAQLNTAQHELQDAGVETGLGIVRVLTGKAALFSQRQDHLGALEMYEDALERRRKVVPREDPELASLLVEMAEVYAEKGDADVALTMLIQAYKRMSEGSSRVVTPAQSCSSSSSTSTTSSTRVPPSFASPSSLSPSSYSSSHGAGQGRDLLIMAAALERIGKLFVHKDQLEDALMCYKAAHERKAAALPRAHPAIAKSLASMAAIYEKKGDYRSAATMHARTLEIRRAVLPPTHTDIAVSLFGLGNTHQRVRAPKSALLAYEEAEAIRRIHGSASVSLGDVLVNISRPLKSLGRDAEAMAKLREARQVYQSAGLAADDVRMCTVNDNMKVLGALLQKGSSGAGGKLLQTQSQRQRLGREGLLMHHAATTTSGTGTAATVQGRSKSKRREQQGGGERKGKDGSCVIM